MLYLGLDVQTLVTFGVKPSLLKTTYDKILARSSQLSSDATHTVATLQALAYQACGVIPTSNLYGSKTKQELSVIVARCQHLTGPMKVQSLNYQQERLSWYGVTDDMIVAQNLQDFELADLIFKANEILSGLGYDPSKEWTAGSTLPVFTAQQVLIHEYSTPSGQVFDRATATTKRGAGNWTAKTPHAIAFTIVMNCRQFATASRLSDYGATLEWYWSKFLKYLDLTEVLILSEVLNSSEISTWNEASLTLPADYATLDKPKKALIVTWLRYRAAGLPVFNTGLTTLAVASTRFNVIGLTSFDLAFSKITSQGVIDINAYLNAYDTGLIKTSDSYIPGVAGAPEAQALRTMILYKWRSLPL